MTLQNLQNKDMNLVLSSDAKPRLKWTQELHQRFVDAVNQLGGADKATPKSLMRVMGIHGLTLYHLKSHLQKYRLGKSQQSQTYSEPKQEEQCEADEGENQVTSQLSGEICDKAQHQINESMKIAQALQMQMEVQRKLYEQIEVQRHLQLRIEAQGKYLQSVLRKAQETLAGYNPSSAVGIELAKEELSQLVTMVDMGCCQNSSLSALTDTDQENPILKHIENKQQQFRSNGCSLESSLTSSDQSSGLKEQAETRCGNDENENWTRQSVVLSLMEMQPGQKNGERKRMAAISAEQQPSAKRFQSQKSSADDDDQEERKFGFLETIDLNSKCIVSDFDSGTKIIDLNSKGVEQPNGYI